MFTEFTDDNGDTANVELLDTELTYIPTTGVSESVEVLAVNDVQDVVIAGTVSNVELLTPSEGSSLTPTRKEFWH